MMARIRSSVTRVLAGAAMGLLLPVIGCGGAIAASAEDHDGDGDGDAGVVAASIVRTLPCEPRRVLETVCQQCHSDPTTNGAPYPLQDLPEIVAVRDGDPVYTLMIAAIEARRMPLTPVTITEADRALLLDWLRRGAPAVTPRACL